MVRLRRQFHQIVALMRSTTFPAERDAAEAKAKLLAGKMGLSYEQALRDLDMDPRTSTSDVDSEWRRRAEENSRKAREAARKTYDDYEQVKREREEFKRKHEEYEAAQRRAREKRDEQRCQAKEARQRDEAAQRERDALLERHQREQEQRSRREAQRRRERAERRTRRPSVIARYGRSKADVLRPTPREMKILTAVAEWRHLTKDGRWTESLDGWEGGISDAPAHVIAAVQNAYPMPTTYQDAVSEWNHWYQRHDDICVVLDISSNDDDGDGLDLPFRMRFDIIEDLILRNLPLTSLHDIVDRIRRNRECGEFQGALEDALLRDLSSLAQQELDEAHGSPQSSTPLDTRIIAALERDASRSNRDIAREIGCSPTVVGRVRKTAGFATDVRTVRRAGQTYQMRRRSN